MNCHLLFTKVKSVYTNILLMRSCTLPLFLLLIFQIIIPCTSNRASSRDVSPKGKTIKAESSKGVLGRGEPSKTGPGKGEPSKAGPSKGESSDEDRPGPSKKRKTCDKRVCGDCQREEENCVGEAIEGKISYCAKNSMNTTHFIHPSFFA